MSTKERGTPAAPPEPSLSEAFRDVGTDISRLVRQEVGLAKAELKQEVTQAAKSAGLLGAAGFAAFMAVLMGSFAAAYGIGSRWGYGWGALVVTGIWLVLGVVMLGVGRSMMRRVSPKPEQTVASLKEDARWARHPMS